MDKDKIEELKDRRLQLREDVRLKKLRERLASQISHVERLGESYTLYYEFENLNWIESNVQIRTRDGYYGIQGDFQIDVPDSITNDILRIKEDEINSAKFLKQFLSLIPESSSLIICHQGGDPELQISVKAFLSNPLQFFCRPETWVITTEKNWIIEYIWDQSVIRFIRLNVSIPTLIKKIVIVE